MGPVAVAVGAFDRQVVKSVGAEGRGFIHGPMSPEEQADRPPGPIASAVAAISTSMEAAPRMARVPEARPRRGGARTIPQRHRADARQRGLGVGVGVDELDRRRPAAAVALVEAGPPFLDVAAVGQHVARWVAVASVAWIGPAKPCLPAGIRPLWSRVGVGQQQELNDRGRSERRRSSIAPTSWCPGTGAVDRKARSRRRHGARRRERRGSTIPSPSRRRRERKARPWPSSRPPFRFGRV